jgi:prevent-host-death family protein
MSGPINIYAAKTHLSRLVDRAVAGEEIVIARAGRPLVKLVPVEPKQPGRRRLGVATGEPYWIAPDFDQLPEDLLQAFEGPIEPDK